MERNVRLVGIPQPVREREVFGVRQSDEEIAHDALAVLMCEACSGAFVFHGFDPACEGILPNLDHLADDLARVMHHQLAELGARDLPGIQHAEELSRSWRRVRGHGWTTMKGFGLAASCGEWFRALH